MKAQILLLTLLLIFSTELKAQTKKGWSVENSDKTVFFSQHLELIGEDSICMVSDKDLMAFPIDKIEKLSFHRDGRSGWPGTFVGTVAGVLTGVLVFSNNSQSSDIDEPGKFVGSTFTGLIGGVIGGAAGGLLYRKRTIEDVVVLTDMFYPQKKLEVKDLYDKYKEIQ